MANIIGLPEREKALREIQTILKELAITNKFLEMHNASGSYTISFKDEEGKKHSTDLTASREEIAALLMRYKNERKEYILQLAREHRIGLDPEDNEILGITGQGE